MEGGRPAPLPRGILGPMQFDLGTVEVHKRKRLPHWDTQHGIYFVTFNLFDAIPRHVRAEKLGESLDDSHGACFMRDSRIAKIVADALTHFDGTRYELFAWCVMPNHVHVVLTLADRIDRVVQGWKSFTSKAANKLLGREGAFWHEDYFDRTVRDSRELHNTIEYVLNNPAKAGLRDWEFVVSYPERIPV